jgi:hypothetical protein
MTTPTSLTPKQVSKTVEDEQTAEMPVLPIHFIRLEDYTTYVAELAVTEGDLVFHFYVTDEVNALPDAKTYWLESFPQILEATSKAYFKAEWPRLKAAYTEEKASWWMRAFGFGHLLEAHKFAYAFLDELDRALDTVMPKVNAT